MDRNLHKYFAHWNQELIKCLRSWGQRSRSDGDGNESLEKTIVLKPLKGFEPKLTKIFTVGWSGHELIRF